MIRAASECPTCGKREYVSKAAAKHAIRAMKGRVGRLNVYRCGNYWHIGHLPADVVMGRIARTDLTPRRRA